MLMFVVMCFQGVSTMALSDVAVFAFLDPVQYKSVFNDSESPPILYPVWVSDISNANFFTPPNVTVFCPVSWYVNACSDAPRGFNITAQVRRAEVAGQGAGANCLHESAFFCIGTHPQSGLY